jgi:hypothetical protein
MSSEHSREILQKIAGETADEGNPSGRPALGGLLIAMAAVVALALMYLATVTAPSGRNLSQAPATTSSAKR